MKLPVGVIYNTHDIDEFGQWMKAVYPGIAKVYDSETNRFYVEFNRQTPLRKRTRSHPWGKPVYVRCWWIPVNELSLNFDE